MGRFIAKDNTCEVEDIVNNMNSCLQKNLKKDKRGSWRIDALRLGEVTRKGKHSNYEYEIAIDSHYKGYEDYEGEWHCITIIQVSATGVILSSYSWSGWNEQVLRKFNGVKINNFKKRFYIPKT